MKLDEYSRYDGMGLAELVHTKQVTAQELKETAFEAIERMNPHINAVASTLPEEAERTLATPLAEGPFTGVPFLIKEFPAHMANVPVSFGSRLAKGMVSPVDSSLMKKFRQCGVVTIGTTTTPEFAFNVTTEAIVYGGPSRNPWAVGRTTGGSSGGAAAAVAAGIMPIAHGNDGGGSIRIPAAHCGIIGFKPTRGRVPFGPVFAEALYGLAAEFAMSRTVRDTAAMLDAVSGPDVGCYAWAERPGESYSSLLGKPVGKLRIAWTGQAFNGAPVDAQVQRALRDTVRLCEELGHEVIEAAPQYDEASHHWMTACFWSSFLHTNIKHMAEALNTKPSLENLESATLAVYEMGERLTAANIVDAMAVQNAVSRLVGGFFTNYDVLLLPTTAQLPLPLGLCNQNAPGITADDYFKQVFTNSPFTNLFNTTGQPAVSLPLGWSEEGLPIGMQFVGRFADEATLIRLSAQLEQAKPWKDKRPPLHVSTLQ